MIARSILKNISKYLLYILGLSGYLLGQKVVVMGAKNSYAVYGRDTFSLGIYQNSQKNLDLNTVIYNKYFDSFLSFYYENGNERGYYTIKGNYFGTLNSFIQNKANERKKSEQNYSYNSGYIISSAIASGAGRSSGKTLGAVTRSIGFREDELTIRGTKFFYKDVFIRWHHIPSCYEYVITILNKNGIEVQKIDTKETFAVLQLEEGYYYLAIKPKCKNDIYKTYYNSFQVLSNEETQRIKNEIAEKSMSDIDFCYKVISIYCILINNGLYENALYYIKSNDKCFDKNETYDIYCE